MEKNSIHLGDCLELMKNIEDKSIDLILCDPPYGSTACHWDTIIPFELLWEQYRRIIKDNGAIVLTASQPFTSLLVCSNLKMFKYQWIWQKNRYGNFIMASRQPIKEQEDVCVFSKASSSTTGNIKMIYNPQFVDVQQNKYQHHKQKDIDTPTKGSVGYSFNRNINEGAFPENIIQFDFDKDRLHPTQKPVALFEYLIKTYTNEGDLVLDNCAGSFTTAIAAINTNRNYICMEKYETYFNIGKDRIKNHLAEQHSKLFSN